MRLPKIIPHITISIPDSTRRSGRRHHWRIVRGQQGAVWVAHDVRISNAISNKPRGTGGRSRPANTTTRRAVPKIAISLPTWKAAATPFYKLTRSPTMKSISKIGLALLFFLATGPTVALNKSEPGGSSRLPISRVS